MSPTLSFMVVLSILGVSVGISLLDVIGRRVWRLAASVLLAGVAVWIYASAAPADLETKGPADESIAVSLCYIAMLFGMAAQYFYRQADAGAEKLTLEPIEFLMPIFASPIVFIPLLTITPDLSVGGALTKPKLMVYLVAFQNGFFWKSFFEEKKQRLKAAPEETQARAA
jgi:hypothetical protein